MRRNRTTVGLPFAVALATLLIAGHPAEVAAELGIEALCQNAVDDPGCSECSPAPESSGLQPIDVNREPFGGQLHLIQKPDGKIEEQRPALENARAIHLKDEGAKVIDIVDCDAAVAAIILDFVDKAADCIDVTITGHGGPGFIKVGEDFLAAPGFGNLNLFCTAATMPWGCCTGPGVGDCNCRAKINALKPKICSLELLGCSTAEGLPGQDLLNDLSLGLGGVPVKGWQATIWATTKFARTCTAGLVGKFCNTDPDCDTIVSAGDGTCTANAFLSNKFVEQPGTKKKVPIPTLSEWGLIGFDGLLLTAMFVAIRWRGRPTGMAA